jgi:hypothetical protein
MTRFLMNVPPPSTRDQSPLAVKHNLLAWPFVAIVTLKLILTRLGTREH